MVMGMAHKRGGGSGWLTNNTAMPCIEGSPRCVVRPLGNVRHPSMDPAPGWIAALRMMSAYIPRGPNVAIGLCNVSNAKQDLSYLCMRACCPFSKRLARLPNTIHSVCAKCILCWAGSRECTSVWIGRMRTPAGAAPPIQTQ